MAQSTTIETVEIEETAREVAVRQVGGAVEVAGLASPLGRTSIADGVVAKIAGIATREVPGVHALGGGVARAFAAVRNRVPGGRPNVAQGVRVEVGTRQCAIDLAIVVEYGVEIAELADALRAHVIDQVETMTGLEVVAVDIAVDDIHLGNEVLGIAQTGRQLN